MSKSAQTTPFSEVSYFILFILVSCDIEFNCHHNANCEYVDNEGRSKCTCTEGFEGNGYECAEKDTSCLFVRKYSPLLFCVVRKITIF